VAYSHSNVVLQRRHRNTRIEVTNIEIVSEETQSYSAFDMSVQDCDSK
jgi:hypothetical protein